MTATRSPGSNIDRNARMKPPDEPVVTTIRSGSTEAAVSIAVVPRDARAQRGDAERGGIIDPPVVERGLRGGKRRLRRRRGRLADFHVNDVAARRLDPGRGRHHVHHHEGWNIAPPRGRQQDFRTRL